MADVKDPEMATVQEESQRLFIRRSTGLVRQIGMREAFAVNMGVLNPGQGFVGFLVALAFFPQTDLTWPYIIAAVTVVLLALTYSQLVAAIPRSGGDYVFLGRLVHPLAGAAIGGMLLLVFLYIAGINMTIWTQQYLPFFFQSIGRAFGGSGTFDSIAQTVGEKTPSFLISIATLIVLCGLAARGVRTMARFMFWCFVIGMVGFAVAVFEYLTHDLSSFAHAFGSYSHNPHAYGDVISRAHGERLATGITTSAVLAAVPFAALSYWGFSWSIYPAGEVKRPMRTTMYSTLAVIGVGIVMYVVAWLAVRSMAGLDFLQSASWLQLNDPTAYGKITSAPTLLSFYALLMSGDPVTKLLMAVGFPAWSFAILMGYILVLSRITFALSFDRLLPTWLTKVTANGSPLTALTVTGVGMAGFTALAIYASFWTAFRNSTLLLGFVFTVVSLTATLMPWLRPKLFEASPKIFRGRWLSLPPIVIVGGLSTIANGFITYLAATKPALSGGYDTGSIVTLAVISLWGAILYLGARLVARSTGKLDPALAMRELPPE